MEQCPHRVWLHRQTDCGGGFKRGRVVVGDHSSDGVPIAFSNYFMDDAAQELA
jgi:hypothetical protein